MLINPVTIRTHRRVIERAIDALKLQLADFDRRIVRMRKLYRPGPAAAKIDDLTFERDATENAILHLQDGLDAIDRAKVEG